jgi:hypothetical protein
MDSNHHSGIQVRSSPSAHSEDRPLEAARQGLFRLDIADGYELGDLPVGVPNA